MDIEVLQLIERAQQIHAAARTERELLQDLILESWELRAELTETRLSVKALREMVRQELDHSIFRIALGNSPRDASAGQLDGRSANSYRWCRSNVA